MYDTPSSFRPTVAIVVFVFALSSVLGFGVWRLHHEIARSDPLGWPVHLPLDTVHWLETVADAVVQSDTVDAPPCPGLVEVLKRLEARLHDGHPERAQLRFNPATLIRAYTGVSCENLAIRLARTLQSEWHFLENSEWRTAAPAWASAQRFMRDGRPVEVRFEPQGLATRSVWHGSPGRFRYGDASPASVARSIAANYSDEPATAGWLTERVEGRRFNLHLGQTRTLHGLKLPQAHDVVAIADPSRQALARTIGNCYVGDATACARLQSWGVAVPDKTQPAAMLAMVVVEIASGRIVAATSTWSDCALAALRVEQPANAEAVTPGMGCANFPDRRAARVIAGVPAFALNVPPGSTAKPGTLLAGLRTGLVNETNFAAWQARLACSRDDCATSRHSQREPQALAVRVGPDALAQALDDLGYSQRLDAAFGDARVYPLIPQQRPVLPQPSALLPWDEMERFENMRQLAPGNWQRRVSLDTQRRRLATRSLMDTAIGGGGITTSALGLAMTLRRIALAERGVRHASAEHFFESPGLPPAEIGIDIHPQHAGQLHRLLSRVTDPTLNGTSASACRTLLGDCPDAGIIGKTGTSDFLNGDTTSCRPKVIRRGVVSQYPAKLFGGLFTSQPGGAMTHAIGVVVLRTPDDNPRATSCLEDRNRAAEAAFTFIHTVRNGLNAELPVAGS